MRLVKEKHSFYNKIPKLDLVGSIPIARSIHVIGYNKKLVAEEKVPGTWEDFLKPAFKGKKFMVDIRPLGFAALARDWASSGR